MEYSWNCMNVNTNTCTNNEDEEEEELEKANCPRVAVSDDQSDECNKIRTQGKVYEFECKNKDANDSNEASTSTRNCIHANANCNCDFNNMQNNYHQETLQQFPDLYSINNYQKKMQCLPRDCNRYPYFAPEETPEQVYNRSNYNQDFKNPQSHCVTPPQQRPQPANFWKSVSAKCQNNPQDSEILYRIPKDKEKCLQKCPFNKNQISEGNPSQCQEQKRTKVKVEIDKENCYWPFELKDRKMSYKKTKALDPASWNLGKEVIPAGYCQNKWAKAVEEKKFLRMKSEVNLCSVYSPPSHSVLKTMGKTNTAQNILNVDPNFKNGELLTSYRSYFKENKTKNNCIKIDNKKINYDDNIIATVVSQSQSQQKLPTNCSSSNTQTPINSRARKNQSNFNMNMNYDKDHFVSSYKHDFCNESKSKVKKDGKND